MEEEEENAVEKRDPDRRRQPDPRDRQDRQAGRRLVRRAPRRHRGAGHRLHGRHPEPARFPAADRRLPREHLRRRAHPRRLLQARGPADREGDPDLPDDRPAAAAAVPRGLAPRDPDHRAGALGRRRERPRHPGDHRRLGRAGALRHPVPRPDRRGARRPHRGRARRQPDQQPARRLGPRPDRRRHRRGDRDGRGRRQRGARGRDARRHLPRPRRRSSKIIARPARDDRRGRRRQAPVRGPAAVQPTRPTREVEAELWQRRSRDAMRTKGKIERKTTVDERRRRRPRRRSPRTTTSAAAQAKQVWQATCEEEILRAGGARPRQASHRRPRASTRSASIDHARSACCRGPTARRCSPAARPRRWSPPRSAPAATRRASTESRARRRRSFMLHYNFPPFSVGEARFLRGPGRREIGHGALARARADAGAARTRTTSPTRSASSPTSSSPTARRRWPPSAAARWR